MKKYILTTLSFILISITACKDDEGSPYYGAWKGSYSGNEDNGSFSVLISEQGEISGTAVSDSLPNFPFNFMGNVDNNGNLSSTINVGFYEIIFTGMLSNNSGNGTWTADSNRLLGIWQAQKIN